MKAFPQNNTAEFGMDLRDWFAGMALQGMCAYPHNNITGDFHCNGGADAIAKCAYLYADAMMEARKK